MRSKTINLLESIQTELNENLNEASKDASMKDLANSLGITGIYTSSEHERDDRDELHGLEGLSFTRKLNEPGHDYYGYAKIIANNLGEFTVSFNMNKRKKEIPLDGFPWKFLQDDAEYQLTDEQKNFIKNNEKELYSLITYVDYHGSEFLEDNKVEENTKNNLKESSVIDKSMIDKISNNVISELKNYPKIVSDLILGNTNNKDISEYDEMYTDIVLDVVSNLGIEDIYEFENAVEAIDYINDKVINYFKEHQNKSDSSLKEDTERDPQDVDLEADVNSINQSLRDLYDTLATHKGQEIVIRLQDAVTDIMNDMAIDISKWDIG